MASIEEVGFRLYRTSGRTLIQPAREARPAGFVETAVSACGFYPLGDLLAAYAQRGELLGGLPYVSRLNYDLLTLSGPAEVRSVYYNGGQLAASGELGFVCGDFVQQEFQPAAEASEAVYAESPEAGWNAGAVSTKAFFREGRVRFRVQAGKRFVVGLGTNTDPLKLGTDAKFIGWRIEGDWVSDLWRGFGDEGSITTGASPTGTFVPFDDTTIFTVELKQGQMRFSRADRDNSSWAYPIPALLTQGDVWMLSAALWEPGTWVEGVEVAAYSGATLALPKLRGRAGQGAIPNSSIAALPRLKVSGRNASRGSVSLPRMQMLAGRKIGQAKLALPRMRTLGQEELRLLLAPRASLRLPELRGSGRSLVGTVGRAALELPATIGRLTQGNIADASLALPMLRTSSYSIPADEGWMHSFAAGDSVLSSYREVFVVMDSQGSITSVLAATIVKDAALQALLIAGDTHQLSALLSAAMISEVLVAADVPGVAPSQVWAVGLAETPATSTFENFAFNSFGVIDGLPYGVREDGVYLLSGDTDNGEPIRASVSFGAQDFGSKTLKHLQRAYVGASSTGRMFLKVVAEGKEYIYAARAAGGEMQQQRFDVGRGLKANYFTFELFNRDGGDFELDSVTFVAAEFKRRI